MIYQFFYGLCACATAHQGREGGGGGRRRRDEQNIIRREGGGAEGGRWEGVTTGFMLQWHLKHLYHVCASLLVAMWYVTLKSFHHHHLCSVMEYGRDSKSCQYHINNDGSSTLQMKPPGHRLSGMKRHVRCTALIHVCRTSNVFLASAEPQKVMPDWT